MESVAYAPNGLAIVSGSRDRTVKIWGSDGILIKTFYGHSDKIWSVAFSNDNHTIASSGFDRIIRVWDIEQGLIYTFQGHGDDVHSIAFSPDGKKVLVANEGEPNGDYTIDPVGSVSIIDLSLGINSATVQTADFTAFNNQIEHGPGCWLKTHKLIIQG